jgi:hypothetical protein
MPRVGSTLRCSRCGRRQRFGERRKRQIAGIVRLSHRGSPSIAPDPLPLDDAINDLF